MPSTYRTPRSIDKRFSPDKFCTLRRTKVVHGAGAGRQKYLALLFTVQATAAYQAEYCRRESAMRPIRLRLAPEYECFPIWKQTEMGSENIDALSLPISEKLKDRIEKWDREFQATYNRDDPMQSGFESLAQEAQWDAAGLEVFCALKSELDSGYSVEYFREIGNSNLPVGSDKLSRE